ncbi:hypothetical protein C0992_005387 [Termitomyces sp. T32_za158]|nr:hypothetical protein C0992_005387 [Termitomyces sp. T32_za158]
MSQLVAALQQIGITVADDHGDITINRGSCSTTPVTGPSQTALNSPVAQANFSPAHIPAHNVPKANSAPASIPALNVPIAKAESAPASIPVPNIPVAEAGPTPFDPGYLDTLALWSTLLKSPGPITFLSTTSIAAPATSIVAALPAASSSTPGVPASPTLASVTTPDVTDVWYTITIGRSTMFNPL